MTKNDKKYKILTEEDIKIIQSDPAGLADYVARTKVKEARKTALIIALIFAGISFAAGFMAGMSMAKNNTSTNVVKVQVGDSQTVATEVEPEVEK